MRTKRGNKLVLFETTKPLLPEDRTEGLVLV